MSIMLLLIDPYLFRREKLKTSSFDTLSFLTNSNFNLKAYRNFTDRRL